MNLTGPDGRPTVVASLLADLPGLAIDVAAAGDDVLILIQRGQVLRRGPDGALRSVAGFLDEVVAITEATGGGALVVEAGPGRVIRVDGDRDATPTVVVEGLTDPRGVGAAPDGSVWVAHRGGVTGFADGRPIASIDAVAEPSGVAATDSSVAVTDPAARRVVVIDRASGATVDAVTGLPIGPPVPGARLPHSASPIVADGAGFVVGCDGDGSIRRLRRV